MSVTKVREYLQRKQDEKAVAKYACYSDEDLHEELNSLINVFELAKARTEWDYAGEVEDEIDMVVCALHARGLSA